VYERTPHQMTSRGAGIVVQPSLTALLSQVSAPALPTTGCTHRNYLAPDGGEGALSRMPQSFTSWEAIYRTLLAAFPAERYHLGAEVAGFDQDGEAGRVSVRLADRRMRNGNADNRYLIYGYVIRSQDLHMLDQMVFGRDRPMVSSERAGS